LYPVGRRCGILTGIVGFVLRSSIDVKHPFTFGAGSILRGRDLTLDLYS